MAPAEAVLFWVTAAIYALATATIVFGLVFRKAGVERPVLAACVAGFCAHTCTIAARYLAQGHLPWSGDYENGLFGGWFIVGSTLLVAWRRPSMRLVGAGTLPVTLLIMGYGAMRSPVLAPLEASLKSTWLAIHVLFAWLAFGGYTLALGAGVLYLIKDRARAHPLLDRMPTVEELDELIFRYIVFGFINDAIMIAAGSIWARDLWGSYWSWDPVETWSLISWLIYALAIHLRLFWKWRGRRLAWIAIVAIAGVIITFFGVTFVVESSNHMFNVR